MSELSNLSLFFLAIAKAGMMTGLLPGLAIAVVAEFPLRLPLGEPRTTKWTS